MRRPTTALLLFGAVCAGTAGDAEAAIFRIQDSSWQADPNNPDASPATFGSGSCGGGEGSCISGDFHIVTKYKDAGGNTVTPANEGTITAWNIRVTSGANIPADNFTFANGSGGTANLAGNVVTFSDPANGGSSLALTFSGTPNALLNTLGNTIDPTGSTSTTNDKWYAPISSATYTKEGSLRYTSFPAVSAQADFVPLGPSMLSLFPIVSTFATLRHRLTGRTLGRG